MDLLDLAVQPAAVDPWRVMREQFKTEAVRPILLRVILLEARTQAFIKIPRTTENAAAEMYDGATMIRPDGPYSEAETAEIVRWANEQWQQRHADATA